VTNSAGSFPIRIGVQLQPQHSSHYGYIRDAVRRCEDIGVDVAFNWDHFYPLYGDPEGAHFECWTMLGAWAEQTSRIEIGAVRREDHGGRGHGATFRGHGGRTAGQPILSPPGVGLRERRDVMEHGAGKKQSAGRRQRFGGRCPFRRPLPDDSRNDHGSGHEDGGRSGDEGAAHAVVKKYENIRR
jgi:hypothetical protein